MFYLVVYRHTNDGDFVREYSSSEDVGKLLMHALDANPNECDNQETTEWHLSNSFPDDVENENQIRKL